MKALIIELNGRELERFILDQPTLFVGRSPSCDVILRVKGVKPLHYLIEWVGEGEFDPDRGFWTLMDLSTEKKDQARGEGLILSQKKTALGRFSFGFTDDAWIEKALQKGRLTGQLNQALTTESVLSSGPGGYCLEVVSVRTDSERVEDVEHTYFSSVKSSQWLLKNKNQIRYQWEEPTKAKIEFLPSSDSWDIRNRDEFLHDGALKSSQNIEISPRDVVVARGPSRQYYIRLVPKIKIHAQWKKSSLDPVVLAFLSLLFLTFAASQFFIRGIQPTEIEKTPERIVKVELPPVKKPLPPPVEPTPEPIPEVQPPKVAAPKPPVPQPKQQVELAPPVAKPKPQAAAKPAATITPKPGAAVAPTQKSASKPGLPGVLGVLRKGSGGAKPLKADTLVADRPSSALDTSSGTVAVARSSPGALVGSKNTGSEKGVDLDSAGTQLKGGFVSESGSGGIAGRDSGTLGSGALGAKRAGTGSGSGSLAGSGFSSQTEVLGGLDREAVIRAIREYTQQIRSCYNNYLTTSTSKVETGRVTLVWQIRPNGSVTANQIRTNSFNDAKLGGCIRNIINRIQFPKAPSGQPTNVVFPFVFQGRSS